MRRRGGERGELGTVESSDPGHRGTHSGRLARVMVGAALVAAFVPLAAPWEATAAGRVALVVGNGTYAHIGRLPNPGNDAADLTAALRRLGFEVTTVRDADRGAMTEALRVFTRASAGAEVSLVFYAGHGLEMDGVNYLVPVDARLERDTDVRFEAVELDYVLASTVGADLRVVILDACRNNPLARSMQRTGASRSVSRGSFGDLNESLLGDETLVAYAAAAGTTADDGTGRNSPYTSALLSYLEQPLGDRVCCSGRFGRGCWRRRTVANDRTSMRRCWGSTTCGRRWARTRGRWRRGWRWTAARGSWSSRA